MQRTHEPLLHWPASSPPARFVLVLLRKPLVERREIVHDRARVDIALAREGRERLRPRPRDAHAEHCLKTLADLFVAVDRAAVERAAPAGLTAGGAVELKLIDVRQEIADVGSVAGDVE